MRAPIFDLLRRDRPNPRQAEFFKARARHVAYGGARGGGKSWAMRRKFVLLAMRYPGLKLLLLRRTLPELRENHVNVMRRELFGYAQYKDGEKAFFFPNGSRIKLGYCDHDADILQYQGQEYDVIGLEEATHFTEEMMVFFTTCNRSVRIDFTPRMYYTANPGGVGHAWFKRLFVDRLYRGQEKAEDYVFIPAKVYDNKVLMRANPDYIKALLNLPEAMRRAHLDGDWDVFAGQYFTEWRRELHVIDPIAPAANSHKYVALDYGLDMLAAYWIEMPDDETAIVYREVYESDLIISSAAKRILETGGGERIRQFIAPPDLWNRRQDSGKSAAEIFSDNGIALVPAKNERVQGWYDLREWLKPVPDVFGEIKPRLRVCSNCQNLIRVLPQVQHDEHDPNDIAQAPHELTHACDALRYFVAGRPRAAEGKRKKPVKWLDDQWEDYYHASEEDQKLLIQRWGNPFA